MDHMRYTEIIEELSDYDPSVKAARVGSTVTIGEIVEMAKEFQAMKEVADERGESFSRSIEDFNNMRDQRDAALAEVERLKGDSIDRTDLKRALDELNAGASEAEF